MLKFSEIFEFSKEKFRKIPILKEFEWFEWFEWFGPSPIEPFNSGEDRRVLHVTEGCPPFNTGRHPHGRPNRAEPLEPYSKFPNESSKSVRSILPTLGNQ